MIPTEFNKIVEERLSLLKENKPSIVSLRDTLKSLVLNPNVKNRVNLLETEKEMDRFAEFAGIGQKWKQAKSELYKAEKRRVVQEQLYKRNEVAGNWIVQKVRVADIKENPNLLNNGVTIFSNGISCFAILGKTQSIPKGLGVYRDIGGRYHEIVSREESATWKIKKFLESPELRDIKATGCPLSQIYHFD